MCLAVLCAWLLWLPLPYGSVVAAARGPLIAVPLTLCLAAAAIRLHATRDRSTSATQPTAPWLIWGMGTLLLIVVVALQLVVLPQTTLAAISPEAAAIWRSAARIAALAGATPGEGFPLTVDPEATRLEAFRLAGLLAAFTTAALLIRTHPRRKAVAIVLCAAATFEVLYGIREAALGRYAVWGWVNHLVFGRVTGTYVNPNHFGHYLAIVLPMALFLFATLWRRAGGPDAPLGRRLALFLEYETLRGGLALLAAVAALGGLLLSQSRGSLLSAGAGLLFVAAMLPGRRAVRVGLAGVAAAATVLALALYLGPERTVERFVRTSGAIEGRREGLQSAIAVWKRFPLTGSGAGTFEAMVAMDRRHDLDLVYSHAHNDYAEIAATTGIVGFAIAIATLIGGYAGLVRMTFGPGAGELSWRRRAFQAAALASITIALVHSLIDFNFFIPANPATLAVIAGASVASLDHDRRTRR